MNTFILVTAMGALGVIISFFSGVRAMISNGAGGFVPQTGEASHSDLLPSLNVVGSLTDNLQLRFGFGKGRLYEDASLVARTILLLIGDELEPGELVRLEHRPPLIEPGHAVTAKIAYVDRYGNAALGLGEGEATHAGLELGDQIAVEAGGTLHLASYARTFADVRQGSLLVYLDSYGNLALAVNRGSAAELLEALDTRIPEPVRAVDKPFLLAVEGVRHIDTGDAWADAPGARARIDRAAPGRLTALAWGGRRHGEAGVPRLPARGTRSFALPRSPRRAIWQQVTASAFACSSLARRAQRPGPTMRHAGALITTFTLAAGGDEPAQAPGGDRTSTTFERTAPGGYVEDCPVPGQQPRVTGTRASVVQPLDCCVGTASACSSGFSGASTSRATDSPPRSARAKGRRPRH